MQSSVNNVLVLIGRLALAALFLPAGLSKITGFTGTVGYIESVGLPLAALGAVIAIIVEIVGGVALIAGFFTRTAAIVLAIFTLLASIFFHAYWAMPADQAFMQQLLFYKNIAVIGGLLILAAHGAGQLSLDQKRVGK
ncbi:DoxX family protein [Orrella daihaiensis]|uniref:DoxX family protein n=1 Tax=Orrella daihaiensis TaxID=2782176 RepID=A0ABY4AJM0_9BURK|nr:DoxX family protein [Orrella daihaiensis]UOD50273.1 DoxX family protein [Orrella daihaiensis]